MAGCARMPRQWLPVSRANAVKRSARSTWSPANAGMRPSTTRWTCVTRSKRWSICVSSPRTTNHFFCSTGRFTPWPARERPLTNTPRRTAASTSRRWSWWTSGSANWWTRWTNWGSLTIRSSSSGVITAGSWANMPVGASRPTTPLTIRSRCLSMCLAWVRRAGRVTAWRNWLIFIRRSATWRA